MALLRNVSPKNAGRAKPTQIELDWTISRASAQYMEALKVDGVVLNYWKRVDEGPYCTCGYGLHKNTTFNNGSTVIENNQIQVAPSNPNLPESQKSINTVIVRGAWDDDDISNKNLPDKVLGADIPNDALKDNFQDVRPQVNVPAQDTGTEDEDDFFSAPEDFDLLSNLESKQCGICLGTGKTNPYSLIGGRREVFDSYTVKDQGTFSKDESTRPYSFKTEENLNSYIEYTYTLPTYFKACLNYSVRNNTKAVRNLALFYKIQGTNDSFQRLTRTFLNSRVGIPTTILLRVQPIVNAASGTLTFTHFEIIWQYSDFPLSQVGPLSVAANNQIRETVMATTFTLPPTIDNVTKDDVFYDYKYNNMWQCTDFTDNMTANRIVLGWSVSARKMQQYEQKTLLQIVSERFYEISYSGLESFGAQLVRSVNE